MGKESTREDILKAAIDLFSKKGFEGVAISEIAKNAGVSEMTLFRHFGTKRNIFSEAHKRFVSRPDFNGVYENGLHWDLRKDLPVFCLFMQKSLSTNEKTIRMMMKTNDTSVTRESRLLEIPAEHRRRLTKYFAEMQARNRMVKFDPEVLATHLIAMNYGLFSMQLVLGTSFYNFDPEAVSLAFIDIFIEGLQVVPQADTPGDPDGP
jgi:AcrR family transcriptional regulator